MPPLPIRAAVLLGACAVLGAGTSAAAAAGVAQAPPRCPSVVPSSVRPSHWAATRQTLAPPGAGAIRLCRYSGAIRSGPITGRLVSRRLLERPSLLAALTSDLDELPPIPNPPPPCPFIPADQVLALLAYPGGQRVRVLVPLAGSCAVVTNGSISRFTDEDVASTQLIAELDQLTGYRAGSTGERGSSS